MADSLAVIDRVIREHQAIRRSIRLSGEAVNDVEALFTIQATQSGWSQSSIADLGGKLSQLLQAVSFMEDGLRNHFAFEEESLPPLLGDLLMKALLREHREVSQQLQDVKGMLSGSRLEGMDQRDLLAKRAVIQQDITDLGQAIEEHAQHEEVILNMLKRTLEKTRK
jgi:hypothetical protein